jgi:predicted PurR-regulated permease PerM
MENNDKTFNISIKTSTIFKLIFILIVIYFLYLVSDILIIFFLSVIFASAFNPWVESMQKRKIPRVVGILIIYFVLFVIIGSAVYFMIPPLVTEFKGLSVHFPSYLNSIISKFSDLQSFSAQHGFVSDIQGSMDVANNYLQSAAGGVFATVVNIFGGLISFFLILVLTFYFVVEETAIKNLVWFVAPDCYKSYIMHLIVRMQSKVGMWLRGQLILNVTIFLLTLIGLLILNVQYALILALVAGITSFVPYVGSIMGSFPAIFISFIDSPLKAVFVAILYYIVHLIEGNILQPKVMQKAVGLNPIISILVLLIGYKLAGVIGIVLSIPATTALSVFLKDIFDGKVGKEECVE